MLSMGGAAGIAHLGAIEAIRASNLPVRCVVGTSMGAVVGGLYARFPGGDTTRLFLDFTHRYETQTRTEAHARGGTGAVVGLLFGLATGGTGLALAATTGGGLYLGASSTDRISHRRFVGALNETLQHSTFAELPVPLRTLYQHREENSLGVTVDEHGSVAESVGRSTANPFFFRDLNPRSMQSFDPGSDRVAAVPVRAACDAFPDAQLLVINVTSEPAVREQGLRCPVTEVRVDVGSVRAEDVFHDGPAFRQLVARGRAATEAQLREMN